MTLGHMSSADEFGLTIHKIANGAGSRLDLWRQLIELAAVERMAEVGVFRGQFAEDVLRRCPSIVQYYMVDPWRHLGQWKRPGNFSDAKFAASYREAMARTDFASVRRTVLRGTTGEVADRVDDESLDLVYIDGDHTLRGIAIDLICWFRKVRPGGVLGGDDFDYTIWQQGKFYEPTLVFPYAVYFAEAVDCEIFGLPFGQFLIRKEENVPFRFTDLTDQYTRLLLKQHLSWSQLLTRGVAGSLKGILRKVRSGLSIRGR